MVGRAKRVEAVTGGAPRIAVLGASRHRGKFGHKCVRAYRQKGWEVIPVNPHAEEIDGLPAVASLAEIEGPLDRISVYLHPADTRRHLDEIAAARAGEVWLNPGSADEAVLAAARQRGLRVVTACSIVDIGLSPAMFS